MAFSAQDSYSFAISAKNQTEKAFNGINSDLAKIDVNVKDVTTGMRTMAAGTVKGLAAMGAASVGALTGIVVASADAAAELNNLSMIAGTSNAQFQEMAYGAKFFGVEQDKLSDILKDVNDKVGDFITTGGGPMADFFNEIAPKVGVTAASFKDLSGPDALQLYVSSLEKANLTQQEMTFYMEAIASDSTALLPLLKDGGAALGEYAAEAQQLGLVLSDIDIAVLDQANKSVKKSADAFAGFAKQLGAKFAPVLTAISNEFLNAAKEAGGFGNIATRVFDAVITATGYAANVVRGLEAVWHGIKLAVVSSMDVVLSYYEMVETGARSIAQYIPGVEVSADSAIGNIRRSIQNVKEDIKKDLSDAVNSPMPSDSIRVWAEEAKAQSQEVAAAVVAAKSGNPTGETVAPEADPEVQAAIARIEYLNMLKDLQLANDTEREELAHLNRMEMLRVRFEEGELPSIESYNRLKEQLEEKHQNKITEIQNQEIKNRETWEQASNANRVKFTVGTMANMFQAFGKHNKKMFEVGKKAAIAETVIATYQSAVNSFNALSGIPIVGPFLGAAAAAAAVAYGMAQVKTIKSQSYQGGGGGGSKGPSIPKSASGVTPITNSASTSSSSQNAGQSSSVVNLRVNIEPEESYSGRNVRTLIEKIAEQTNLNVSY